MKDLLQIKTFFFVTLKMGTTSITSTVGSKGTWSSIRYCWDRHYAVGFKLAYDVYVGAGHNHLGAIDLMLQCKSYDDGSTYWLSSGVSVQSSEIDDWYEVSCGSLAIIGMKTRVKPDGGILSDDRALVDLAVFCGYIESEYCPDYPEACTLYEPKPNSSFPHTLGYTGYSHSEELKYGCSSIGCYYYWHYDYPQGYGDGSTLVEGGEDWASEWDLCIHTDPYNNTSPWNYVVVGYRLKLNIYIFFVII